MGKDTPSASVALASTIDWGESADDSSKVQNSQESTTSNKIGKQTKTQHKRKKSKKLDDKIKNLTGLAQNMIAKATESDNVFKIPDVIEEFKPKRVGHIEH